MTSTHHGILIHMLFAYLLMYIEVFEDMSSWQYRHILETVRSAREQLFIIDFYLAFFKAICSKKCFLNLV